MNLKIEGLVLEKNTPDIYLHRVLTDPALAFLRELHERFNPTRRELLAQRHERQARLDAGQDLDFLPETAGIREAEWMVAGAPKDLNDRRVEITGPTDAKMVINALNSGAKVFMADFEDAQSPTWMNVMQGQVNLQDAIRDRLSFTSDDGRSYQMKPADERATLVVRPRGWHLPEKNLTLNGEPLSASLVDFGLYFFHNAEERRIRGSAPYFYLPKMESYLEARLWNDVFNFAQDYVKIPRGSIRATCLIETINAAFQMEEFLYELRDHAAGLNAGRWDYIFSLIKKHALRPDRILPDRSQVTMNTPFMRAYAQLLVRTCHKRGAHAIGGMAAFIPSRKDAAVNERAIAKVTEDKTLEAEAGFDGTWVAHPDLVPVAQRVFDEYLGHRPHQKHKLREDVIPDAKKLLDTHIPGGRITEEGVRHNIRVAIQYMNCWLNGLGAVGLYNLMEDAATAEISRAQLWQWVHHKASMDDGRVLTPELYSRFRNEELDKLGGPDKDRHKQVIELLDGLVLAKDFNEFLTLPAYQLLDTAR
ncbi:malate synthase A [Oligoflexus tunisiensis]|uniref:malate synthase A n=1 Tax=Oligoflexus tunisiensis TaxID=708132 RepID=UPI000A90D6EE|nr:malate synthase A [Oligoflexus tunisiensis]